MTSAELQFTVETWNAQGNFERLLSRSALVTVARGAFQAAVEEFPEKTITLREGTRVIREHPGRSAPGDPAGNNRAKQR